MFDPWQQIRVTDAVEPRPNRPRTQNITNGIAGIAKQKNATVLVVDDEHLIADTMTEILKRSGFQAVCAYDGRSGLELALEVNPDFVVTDVVMPKMNGIQLAIAIRKALPTTEIFLLSGQAGIAEIVEHGRKEGYLFELIAKPVHPEKLIQRLRES